jgi:hypothetical protein
VRLTARWGWDVAKLLAETLRRGNLGGAEDEVIDTQTGMVEGASTGVVGSYQASVATPGVAPTGIAGLLQSTVLGVPLWLVGIGAWLVFGRK